MASKAEPTIEQLKARIALLEGAGGRLTKEVLVQMMHGLQADNLWEAYCGMRDVLSGEANFHKRKVKPSPTEPSKVG